MATVSRIRRAWLAQQSSGISADPSTTDDPSADGSGYTAVPTQGRSFMPSNAMEILETDNATGRNTRSAHESGVDMSEVTLEIPARTYSTSSGDGVAAPADTYMSFILESAFGAPDEFAGEGVASATSNTVVLDTDPGYTQGDLIHVYDASANGGVGQWRHCISDSTVTFTIDPANWTDDPTATGDVYGSQQYAAAPSVADGPLLAGVFDIDGTIYTCLGGRPTSLSLTQNAKGRVVWSVTIKFDQKTEDASAKSALPAHAAQTFPAIKGTLAALWWGATAYPVKSVAINWNIAAEDCDATIGPNGRSDITVLSADPTIEITPLYDETVWETDFDASTEKSVLIEFGSGTLNGTTVNTMGFWGTLAQITAVAGTADGNRLRHNTTLALNDPGTTEPYWRLAMT